jgi:hypothetical protein
MKILVSSNFSHCADRPGAFDNRMAFVLGLRRLGHDVFLVEDVAPERCYDDSYEPVPFANWKGKERFRARAEALGLWPRCSMVFDGGRETCGLPLREIVAHARSADLLVSVASALETAEIRDAVACRVYVDTAPAKVQVYHAEYGVDYGFDHYHHWFTFGLNLGTDDCPIPDCGVRWQGLLPPVVLPEWPVAPAPDGGSSFTTVSSWAGSKHTFEYGGVYSGDKADEWRRFAELPRRTGKPMEIALKIHPAWVEDIELLQGNGWALRDAAELDSVSAYRTYMAGSRAEFSIANARYVRFDTGFFGDRTARYLASGRPALVQSTGFERHLPVGEGLMTFETLEEAAAGLEEIDGRWEAHARAAREIAVEHFDSDRVLSGLLSEVGA